MGDMSFRLAVDIGNTRTKTAVFEQGELKEVLVSAHGDTGPLALMLEKYPSEHSIISSVIPGKTNEEAFLESRTMMLRHSPGTALPFTNLYGTPETLGADRSAGVAGALHLFPGRNTLVIDAGTCITYDLLTANREYYGGSISPGLHMRLKAMHHFTGKLPEVAFREPGELIGGNTEEALLSGAFFGMTGEINAIISRYEERCKDLQVVICGGDAELFGKHIKKNIFAAPYLVLYGLNKILSFNVDKGL